MIPPPPWENARHAPGCWAASIKHVQFSNLNIYLFIGFHFSFLSPSFHLMRARHRYKAKISGHGLGAVPKGRICPIYIISWFGFDVICDLIAYWF